MVKQVCLHKNNPAEVILILENCKISKSLLVFKIVLPEPPCRRQTAVSVRARYAQAFSRSLNLVLNAGTDEVDGIF